MFGNRKKARGNDLAVGDNGDEIGRKSFEESLDFGGTNFFRLVQGEMRCERDFFHWRKRDLVASALGPVGLGDDGKKFEIRIAEEMLESRNCKLRGATED
jgi:hypothetical protein